MENIQNITEQKFIDHQAQIVAAHYDKEAEGYTEMYSTPLCKAEDTVVVSVVESILDKRGIFIEIGCGQGLLAQLLETNLPMEYYAFDLSPKGIAIAKQKFPGRSDQFHVGDMNKELAKFPDESVATIASIYGPMSYPLAPQKPLNEIDRILKPGGWFALMFYTKRVEYKFFIGESTADADDVPKICYSEQDLDPLFSSFANVRYVGINYMQSFVEAQDKYLRVEHPQEFWEKRLLKELHEEDLPIEYARHVIVIGQKPFKD